MFSVALSVESRGSHPSQKARRMGHPTPSRTLSGTPLYGVRTFLSPRPKTQRATVRSGCLRNHYLMGFPATGFRLLGPAFNWRFCSLHRGVAVRLSAYVALG